MIHPYALRAGEGWTYSDHGPEFILKAGERGLGRRLAFIEYTTRSGEEPADHTHTTEDEIFYVLQGSLTFRCGDKTFELDDSGFVFLPRGIEHGYKVRSDGDVHLLVVTSPSQPEAIGGWGGFVASFEDPAKLLASPPSLV